MKYTSALVLVALLGAANIEHSQAVNLSAGFSDDLIKSLTEEMQKDTETDGQSAAQEEQKEEVKEVKKEEKKPAAKKSDAKKSDKKSGKKDAKKDNKKAAKPAKVAKKEEVDTEIPMDQAAIKAYSSVIADAAEDSEPASPVQYHAVMELESSKPQPADIGGDPMASMIQNEISSIKDASVQAAKDKMDE